MTDQRPGLAAGLRLLRTTAGLTTDAVAEAAGLSADYLVRVENGEVHPRAEWVHLVAQAIGEHLMTKEQQ